MSLNFACLAPHPPVIVKGIGSDEDLAKITDTIIGMRKLTTSFNEADIDTLIVISPHGLVYPDRFNICGMQKLFGTFAEFQNPDIIIEAENNLELVDLIAEKMDETQIKFALYDNGGEFYELDHGAMVPLTYFKQNQESVFKIVPVTYSNLDKAAHFAFGEVIREAADSYPGRVGILASGDLSHQLFQNPDGKKFDNEITKDLSELAIENILQYENDYIENIGECGYRSILILLGAIEKKEVTPEILSYEGPFGVGYLVANFGLKDNS